MFPKLTYRLNEAFMGDMIRKKIILHLLDGDPKSTNDEEDILNWDTAIVTPPPRRSGTIRVKLIYKGRSKPFPIENFWEE